MAAPKVNIRIDGDASGYTSALRKSERETQKAKGKIGSAFSGIGAKMSGLAAPAAAAGAAIAGAAVVAWDFAKAAAEDADQAAILAGQMRRVIGATNEQIAATEEWITAQSLASGVADSELRPALGRLVTVTGELGEAQRLLTLSMDIAAATGKPLETVVKAVSRAAQGSSKPLEKLTGVLDLGGKGADAWGQYQAVLNQQFGGAQALKADTYGGKMERISKALGEAQEALGEKLLPYLEDFSEWATSSEGAQAIEDTAEAFESVVSALGELVNLNSKVEDLIDSLGDLKYVIPLYGQGQAAWDWWNSRNRTAAPSGNPNRYPGNPGGSVTVNVSGALDPLSSAQAVRRALASDSARGGTVRVRTLS